MNRNDILRMAREAGISTGGHPMNPWDVYPRDLERFAALVAAAEREACASRPMKSVLLQAAGENEAMTSEEIIMLSKAAGLTIYRGEQDKLLWEGSIVEALGRLIDAYKEYKRGKIYDD